MGKMRKEVIFTQFLGNPAFAWEEEEGGVTEIHRIPQNIYIRNVNPNTQQGY
jgi:hypothetical protein